MNNYSNFMQSVKAFRQQMLAQNPNQNPDQIVQQMMSTGRLSQSQYEAARQQAIQIQKMMNPGSSV